MFVPDREAFLDSSSLKSEARMSALEFERQRAIGTDLSSILARGWRHLLRVRACIAAQFPLRPVAATPVEAIEELAPKVTAAVQPTPMSFDDETSHTVSHPSQGMRMSL